MGISQTKRATGPRAWLKPGKTKTIHQSNWWWSPHHLVYPIWPKSPSLQNQKSSHNSSEATDNFLYLSILGNFFDRLLWHLKASYVLLGFWDAPSTHMHQAVRESYRASNLMPAQEHGWEIPWESKHVNPSTPGFINGTLQANEESSFER